MIEYRNYWPNFDPNEHFFHHLFKQLNLQVSVVGPFKETARIDRIRNLFQDIAVAAGYREKAEFFITGENKLPQFHRAKKQIGFWRSYRDREDVFRFPYWMWHLDWEELSVVPDYPRYGKPLSIDRLMRPISSSYTKDQLTDRLNRAVIFSMHLREPRRRFMELTQKSIGCDGFGGAFGKNDRARPKMPILEKYQFSLCPENSIGDGYITEKIPEAFHAGCVPIGWCRPEDLEEDFNPEAVINLYGLDNKQICELLSELKACGALYSKMMSEPLLVRRPDLDTLMEFISDV